MSRDSRHSTALRQPVETLKRQVKACTSIKGRVTACASRASRTLRVFFRLRCGVAMQLCASGCSSAAEA